MALQVIAHYPTINATGVFRNDTVQIGFNKPIHANSVTWSVMSVNDTSTFSNVVGDLGVIWDPSGNVTGIYFTPEINYTANSSYSVYVYQSPDGVIATNGEEITNTYSWTFITGTGLLGDVPSGGVPSGDIPSSGSSTYTDVYNDLIASGFRVIYTDPSNQTPQVDIDIDKIRIQFNTDIWTSISDMSGFVSIVVEDVLY